MKIELTDKQVYELLEEVSEDMFYTYFSKHSLRFTKLFNRLMNNTLNTERFVTAYKLILERVPLQKELF